MARSVNKAWQEATAASEQEHWEDAIALWHEITQRNPDEADGFVNLGTALFSAAQYDAAITAYQEALRLAPDDAGTHAWLGSALSAVGQPNAALEHWEEAMRLDPCQIEARYNVGYTLSQRGEYEAAIEQWREIVRLKPSDWQAHQALGYAFFQKAQTSHSRKDWRLSWAAYKQAAKFNPQQDADTLWWLGHLEWKFGSRRSAERTMKAALEADPDDQWAYGELTRMQFFLGHWRDSLRTAQAATERPTFDPHACQICWHRLSGAVAVLALLTVGVLVWSRRRLEDAS